ncbi:MAG TPA: hypothetical protein VHZ51_02470 [Ktedonobacteraceae bacterium]|nr:hypothetical protein [Ktedonobacteraceae bacterium]
MDQSSSIHALRENMQGAQEGIKDIKKRLDTMDRIEEKLNLILTFLKPS